tara:strand:+ start:143 stop:292 length:150 start_codon:yes stop_codon:yes gene_type:complete
VGRKIATLHNKLWDGEISKQALFVNERFDEFALFGENFLAHIIKALWRI